MSTINENKFALILNLLDVRVSLPCEIATGHWLRKADEGEVKTIRNFLQNTPARQHSGLPFEFSIMAECSRQHSRRRRNWHLLLKTSGCYWPNANAAGTGSQSNRRRIAR